MKSGFCAPAVDETVILLHHPLPLAGVSTVMERERQQNDSLVHGQVAVHDVFGAKDLGWHTATFNLAAPGESPTAHSPPPDLRCISSVGIALPFPPAAGFLFATFLRLFVVHGGPFVSQLLLDRSLVPRCGAASAFLLATVWQHRRR